LHGLVIELEKEQLIASIQQTLAIPIIMKNADYINTSACFDAFFTGKAKKRLLTAKAG
tara:strand:+ start:269 stop:442 length:174 start_codon:yes stop_codon:yes gene_type:complete